MFLENIFKGAQEVPVLLRKKGDKKRSTNTSAVVSQKMGPSTACSSIIRLFVRNTSVWRYSPWLTALKYLGWGKVAVSHPSTLCDAKTYLSLSTLEP